MSRFADKTSVPAEKTRQDIEKTLKRYGAQGFFYATEKDHAVVGFRAHNRIVRFSVPMPSLKSFRSERGHEQAIRTRWRCLLLAIKAKLEVVETGISSFEEEFLAHIVTYDGRTVGQAIVPKLQESYESGKHVPLLLGDGQ